MDQKDQEITGDAWDTALFGTVAASMYKSEPPLDTVYAVLAEVPQAPRQLIAPLTPIPTQSPLSSSTFRAGAFIALGIPLFIAGFYLADYAKAYFSSASVSATITEAIPRTPLH